MKINEKYEYKYIASLFTNIAILNALEYVKINNLENKNKIKEQNMKDFFDFNKSWNNLINKYYNNINTNVDEQNKELIDKKEKIKTFKTKGAPFLIDYLAKIRNYYAHDPEFKDKKSGKTNQEIIKQIREEFEDSDFKKILSRSNINLEHFNVNEWELFLIAIFLKNSELNYLEENLEKIPEFETFKIFLKKRELFKKYQFKFRNVKSSNNNIYTYILNYLKTFDLSKNKKTIFLNICIKILNKVFYINKMPFKFKKYLEYPFLVELINSKTKKSFLIFNLKSIKLLLRLIKIDNIKKIFYLIKNDYQELVKNNKNYIKKFKDKKDKNDNEFFKDYKSFKNRYQNINTIPLRHLLKTFNRILVWKHNFYLKDENFESLFQAINTDNKKLFYEAKINIWEKLNNDFLDKYQLIPEESVEEWKQNIANFILEKIRDKNKMIAFFNRNKDKKNNFSENESIQNESKQTLKKLPIVIHFKNLYAFLKDKKFIENDEILANEKLKSIKINKNSKTFSLFNKYIFPICNFCLNNNLKEQNSKNKPYQDYKKHFNDIEIEQISQEIFDELFKNKFDSEKDLFVSIYFNIDNAKQNPLELRYDFLQSQKDIINSKLFYEIWQLLRFKKLEEKDFKKIVELIDWFKNKEYFLHKKIIDLSNSKDFFKFENDEINFKDFRNFIFHRSLSEFEKIEYMEKYINKFLEPIKEIKASTLT